MTTTPLHYRSIDEYLGPSDTRFFGAGYRRAHYELGRVRLDPDASQVTSSVSLTYPTDWSKKTEGIDLRPHLSTVDTLVLSVQLCDVYLAAILGLDRHARQRAWLRKVTIRAGSRPQEELADVPMSVQLRETKGLPDPSSPGRSVFDCTVGTMRARCEVEHSLALPTPAPPTQCDVDDVVGPAGRRYYGDGFKAGRHHIRNVSADLDRLTAAAEVEIYAAAEAAPADEGIEGGYQPTVSMVDCFVTNIQLAQVLLYEMDSVDRRDSSTLWMLQTTLEAASPQRPSGKSLAVQTAFSATRLLNLRGGVWRNVDITGRVGGVELRSSFAHELAEPPTVHDAERIAP